jgi:YVTN family beta-propeller protein
VNNRWLEPETFPAAGGPHVALGHRRALVLGLALATMLVLGGVVSRASATTLYRAYVAAQLSTTVTSIELASGEVGTSLPINNTSGVAITPNSETAYVTGEGSGTVTPVDVASNEAGTPIPVGKDPTGIAITPNGETAYVANSGSDTVTPIELASGKAGTPIPVGLFPFAVAITPDGKTAYVSNANSGTVTPIDVGSNKAGTAIEMGEDPRGLAITPNGKTIYVASGLHTVRTIDVASNKPGKEITVGPSPEAVAITPDGAMVYVANYFGGVTPITVATNKPGPEIPVGIAPDGIAIAPNGETAYVANELSNSVTPITIASNSAGTEIPVGLAPAGIAIATTIEAKPADIELPKVAGSAVVGATLSCSHGKWTASPVPSFTYQWLREGSAIPGANGTEYSVAIEDQGFALACEVTVKNSAGSVAADSSPVPIPPEAEPVSLELPKISGSGALGATLSCSEGKWASTSAPSLTFQWLRDGGAISGANSSQYKVAPEDQGHGLVCEVAAENGAGTTSARSASLAIAAAPLGTGAGGSGGAGSGASSSISIPVEGQDAGGVAGFSIAKAAVAVAGPFTSRSGAVLVPLRCSVGAGRCTNVTVKVMIVEELRNRRLVALIAEHRAKVRKRTVVIGELHLTMSAGESQTFRVPLNGAGKALIADHVKLRVEVGVLEETTTIATQAVMLTRAA